MNFRKPSPGAGRDEPEINLIPFIDVLLVVLIFLVLTTTFSRQTGLQLTLPAADAEASRAARELVVAVDASGRYAVDGQPLDDPAIATLVRALEGAARARGNRPDQVVLISADARTSHQSVVKAMDAARRCGLQRIAFATQKPSVL